MLKHLHRFISKGFQTIHLDYHVEMKPRYGWGNPAHRGLEKIIASNHAEYSSILREVYEHLEFFKSIELKTGG